MDDTHHDNNIKQKASLESRFNKIKNLFEAKRSDTDSSNPHMCKDKPIEELSKETHKWKKLSPLEQFKEYRKKTNFSTLAENFGYYTLLKDSTVKYSQEELEATLEKLRASIILKSEGDFQSKLKIFGKRDEKAREEEANLSIFINETNEMCENYEKEIMYLRCKMDDIQKKYEKKWAEVCIESSVDHAERNIEILSEPKAVFMNKMNNLKDPSVLEITNIYNEKIAELFDENESLNRKIKKLTQDSEVKVKLEGLVNNLTKTIKEKDDNIKTINEIYQSKFSEVFIENDKLSGEIIKLKKVINDHEAAIQSHQAEEKRMKELLQSHEKSNIEHSSDVVTAEYVSSLQEKISSQEKEIAKLQDALLKVQEEKSKEISFVGNDNSALEDVKRYYETKLAEIETDCKTFENKAIKFEKRYKLSEGENEQLKDIITKDQLRIRHLMEIKEKYEQKNKLETTTTSNEIETLKEENEMMRVRLSTIDRQKNRDTTNITMATTGSSSIVSNDFTRNLVTDYLYMLYLSEISINAQQIIEVLLNNFQLYLSTSFLTDNFSLTFSIMNEFIEDIFFRVSDECMLKKLSSGLKGKDVWMIKADDITQDIVKDLCFSFYEENPINTIVKNSREVKSIEEIIDSFVQKHQSTIDLKLLNEFILTEVKPVLVKKIERLKRTMLSNIQTLIELCVKNIRAGTIDVNGREVYNFKNYSMQFSSRDLSTRGAMKINLATPLTMESIDNLVTGIKSNADFLKHIYFSGDLYPSIDCDPPLAKLSMGILIHCPKIDGLHINRSNPTGDLGKHVINLIDNLKNLKLLDLSENSLEDEGLQLFSNGLKIHKGITDVNLSQNNLTGNSGFVLAEILVANKTIEKLNLSNNLIKGSGLSSIFTVLCNTNSILKELDVSNNSLSNEDMTNLCDFLHKNPHLTSLNISGNPLDAQTANLLGVGLPKAKHLKKINISRMNLTEESGPLLFNQLNTTQLEEIIINENPLGEVGIIVAASVMKNNQSLKFLEIKGYTIPPAAVSCIGNAICHNSVLDVLNLEEDDIDEEGMLMLMGFLKERSVKVKMSAEKIPVKLKESVLLMKSITLS